MHPDGGLAYLKGEVLRKLFRRRVLQVGIAQGHQALGEQRKQPLQRLARAIAVSAAIRRNVEGIRSAARALGLTADDQEYFAAMREAAAFATPHFNLTWWASPGSGSLICACEEAAPQNALPA